MNAEDTVRILTMLQGEYPGSFSKLDERQMDAKMELWIQEFERDDYNLVYPAVRILIKEPRAFSPTIGEIREKMRLLVEPDELTEADAWALVSKACANGLYGAQKEFDKLPPEIQRVVGSPEQIKLWAAMDAETVQSVVASNFQRAFRVRQACEKELSMIPADMRKMIQGAANSLKLLGGST